MSEWISNLFVPVVSGLIIWWLLTNIPQIAQLGWKGTFTVVVITYALFWLFTNNDSPAKVVPVIDGGYTDVTGQVAESQMANDFAKILKPIGVDQQTLGLSTSNNNLEAPVVSGLDLNPNASGDASQVVVNPVASGAFGAMRYTMTSDTVIPALDSSGAQINVSIMNGQQVCVDSWSSDGWLNGCDNQSGYRLQFQSWMAGLPSSPSQTNITQSTVQLTNEQLGQCWMVFASKNLTGDAEFGAQALPAGTSWMLKGPGGFADFGSWTGKKGEEWTLTNIDLGIENYPINGSLGRSFPNADDSGSVLVYGQNVQIQPACAKALQR